MIVSNADQNPVQTQAWRHLDKQRAFLATSLLTTVLGLSLAWGVVAVSPEVAEAWNKLDAATKTFDIVFATFLCVPGALFVLWLAAVIHIERAGALPAWLDDRRTGRE